MHGASLVRVVLLAVLVGGVLLPSPAQAAHPQVQAARSDFEQGEFGEALVKLVQAKRAADLTEADLVDLYWLRGASYHALGRQKEAGKAFDELLKLRPLFEPSAVETPPDLRAFFRTRSDAFHQEFAVKLGEPTLDGLQLVVPVQGGPAKVVVFARAPGEATFHRYELPVSGDAGRGEIGDVALWREIKSKGGVELVLEAHDERDIPQARIGETQKPLQVAVTEEQASRNMAALLARETKTEPSAEAPTGETPKGSNLPLLIAGAGGLGVGTLAGALGVVALVLGGVAAAVAGGVYYYAGNVVGSGKVRTTLSPIYLGAIPTSVILIGVSALLIVVGVVGGGAGAAALVARKLI